VFRDTFLPHFGPDNKRLKKPFAVDLRILCQQAATGFAAADTSSIINLSFLKALSFVLLRHVPVDDDTCLFINGNFRGKRKTDFRALSSHILVCASYN